MSNPKPNRQPATEFKPGNKLGGRKHGSRDKLSGEFIRRLAEDFKRFGIYAIARVRHHDPAAYLRLVAGLLPKELTLQREEDLLDRISDEDLATLLAAARDLAGTDDADGDEGESGPGEKATVLH